MKVGDRVRLVDISAIDNISGPLLGIAHPLQVGDQGRIVGPEINGMWKCRFGNVSIYVSRSMVEPVE